MTECADKLTYTNLPENHFMAHVRYNDLPPGWRELTEEEFAKSQFGRYSPNYFGYKQIFTTENGQQKFLPIHWLSYVDGTGLAIHTDYWKGKVRYFFFGCDHDYKGLSQQECRERGIYHAGRCYHVAECQKCKFINAVDSSD